MKDGIQRCGALTRKGTPCRNPAVEGGRCWLHKNVKEDPAENPPEADALIRMPDLEIGDRDNAEIEAKRTMEDSPLPFPEAEAELESSEIDGNTEALDFSDLSIEMEEIEPEAAEGDGPDDLIELTDMLSIDTPGMKEDGPDPGTVTGEGGDEEDDEPDFPELTLADDDIELTMDSEGDGSDDLIELTDMLSIETPGIKEDNPDPGTVTGEGRDEEDDGSDLPELTLADDDIELTMDFDPEPAPESRDDELIDDETADIEVDPVFSDEEEDSGSGDDSETSDAELDWEMEMEISDGDVSLDGLDTIAISLEEDPVSSNEAEIEGFVESVPAGEDPKMGEMGTSVSDEDVDATAEDVLMDIGAGGPFQSGDNDAPVKDPKSRNETGVAVNDSFSKTWEMKPRKKDSGIPDSRPKRPPRPLDREDLKRIAGLGDVPFYRKTVRLPVYLFLAALFVVIGVFVAGFFIGGGIQASTESRMSGLTATGLDGRVVANDTLGNIFVVSGKVKNTGPSVRGGISMTAKLYLAGGFVKTITNYAGNLLSDEELALLDEPDIRHRLGKPEGDGGVNRFVKAGASLPFMVVFTVLPDNLTRLDRFTVEVSGASK